jgi:hypothetical protein
VEDAASERPNLALAQKAWICKYWPADRTPPDGYGAVFDWVRAGRPTQVDSDTLAAINETLPQIIPVPPNQACNDDLGPRWMIVTVHETDLTGVVIDDYGCSDVRLTDEPFTTPPGEASQSGTVAGVLGAPAELLDTVHRTAQHS